jgi:hypothetical protein
MRYEFATRGQLAAPLDSRQVAAHELCGMTRSAMRPTSVQRRLGRTRALVCLLTLALLPAPWTQADDRVLVLGNDPTNTLTPEQIRMPSPNDDLRVVAYDPAVASTYGSVQSQTNARLIQYALQNQDSLGKILVMPVGKWYCVADHDADGADIKVTSASGLTWISAGGWNDRISDNDLFRYTLGCEGGLIHTGDVGPSGDVVVWLDDFRNCRLALNIRGVLAASTGTAISAMNFSDPENHSVTPCALRLTDTDRVVGDASSGKSEISLSALCCYRAIDIWGDPTHGPDTMNFPFNLWRFCHYGMRARGVKTLDFHFHNLLTSGSGMQRGIEFPQTANNEDERGGGVLKVDNWYLSPGTNLYVESPGALSRCDIHVRGDNLVLGSEFKLLEMANGTSAGDVRITGSYNSPVSHQTVLLANDSADVHSVQMDVAANGDSAYAYPIRPTRGQWVPREVEPNVLSSTKLFINADRDFDGGYGSEGYNHPNTVVDPVTRALTSLADLSASGNVLVPDGTGTLLTRGLINCRDAMEFSDSHHMLDATPSGVNEAINDFTLDAVLKVKAGDANRWIYWCRTDAENGGTGGIRVGVNGANQIQMQCGTDAMIVTNEALAFDRTYRVRITRTRSSGAYQIFLNGKPCTALSGSLTGNSTSTFTAQTGPLVIGRLRTTGPNYNDGWKGSISQIVWDNAILSGPDLAARDTYMRQFGGW